MAGTGATRLVLAVWFAKTTMIGLVAMIVAALLSRRAAVTPDDTTSEPDRDVGAVWLGKDVLALQVEDHYVRVHRTSGSELILMPLGRAIAGVEAEGVRVHRLWRVVGHAVQKVEGNARSMRLHLSNGVIASVARSAVIYLKAAGWLVERADRTLET